MHGYAAGWPPLFIGDLHYDNQVYDLTPVAQEIDTENVGVHILSGEYDYSATREMGKMAHEAIKGATLVEGRARPFSHDGRHATVSAIPDAGSGYHS